MEDRATRAERERAVDSALRRTPRLARPARQKIEIFQFLAPGWQEEAKIVRYEENVV